MKPDFRCNHVNDIRELTRDLQISTEAAFFGHENLSNSRFVIAARNMGCRYFKSFEVTSRADLSADTQVSGLSVAFSSMSKFGKFRLLLAENGNLALISGEKVPGSLGATRYTMWLASREKQEIVALQARLEARIPMDEEASTARFDCVFWSDDKGWVSKAKSMGCIRFSDIEENYPEATWNRLKRLVDLNLSEECGKLLLLFGQPGTGKTYFIRALMTAWKDWCDFVYVVDPDQFFCKGSYMLEVLLSKVKGDRHTLFIMEDVDELISIDAKERTGQALSRLLNCTDGLIGQSLKIAFLTTTNEDVEKLHPAIIREGRCIANVEFRPFEPGAARLWLEKRGCEVSGSARRMVLTDLYAAAAGGGRLCGAREKLGVR